MTTTVRVALDVARHRFLRDHLVGGRALLSTVMGVETIARTVQQSRPGTRVAAVHDLRVGPAYLLPPAGVGAVEVTMTGTHRLACEVRSEADSGAADPHLRAELSTGDGDAPEPPGAPPRLPPSVVRADEVYGLYFHGPSFRVIGAAGVQGRTATARLARHLPPIVDGDAGDHAVGAGGSDADEGGSVIAPLLVELCLQTAGLWDLAAGNGMTIPHSIARIRRCTRADSDSDEALFAVVQAVPDPTGHHFDARVVDAAGHVQLAVDGYRTTPFGHDFDTAAADRIRAALTRSRRA